MRNVNYEAVLIMNQKKFFLSEEEIKSTGIAQAKWVSHRQPPILVCTKLLRLIRNKYKNELTNSQSERLAARIVDLIFVDFINLLRIGGINAEEGAYSFNAMDKQMMEGDRLDAQARSGQIISREEFEEYYNQKK